MAIKRAVSLSTSPPPQQHALERQRLVENLARLIIRHCRKHRIATPVVAPERDEAKSRTETRHIN